MRTRQHTTAVRTTRKQQSKPGHMRYSKSTNITAYKNKNKSSNQTCDIDKQNKIKPTVQKHNPLKYKPQHNYNQRKVSTQHKKNRKRQK